MADSRPSSRTGPGPESNSEINSDPNPLPPFQKLTSSSLFTAVCFKIVRTICTGALTVAARNRVEIEIENGLWLDPSNPNLDYQPERPPNKKNKRGKAKQILRNVCVNERSFVDLLVKRAREGDRERGLLTISNHISILDDPLMWATLQYSNTVTGLPKSVQYILSRPQNMRWSLGSHDICFQDKTVSNIFFRGQTLPTHRLAHSQFGGPFQSTIGEAIKLLSHSPHQNQKLFPLTKAFSTNNEDSFPSPTSPKSWLHVFPEGRVAQPALEARFPLDPTHAIDEIAVMQGHCLRYFKWGTARFILETEPCPDVVPMWIRGFDAIVPEPHVLLDQQKPGQSILPGEVNEVSTSTTKYSTKKPTFFQGLQAKLPHRIAQIAEWVNPAPGSHHVRNSPTGGMPRVIFGDVIPVNEWDGVRQEWQALLAEDSATQQKEEKEYEQASILASTVPHQGTIHSSFLQNTARAQELRSRVAEMLRQRVLAVGRQAGAQDVLIADQLGLNGESAKTSTARVGAEAETGWKSWVWKL